MKNLQKFSLILVLVLSLISIFNSFNNYQLVEASSTQGVIVYGESQKTVSPDTAIIYSTIKMHNKDVLTSKDDCLNTFLKIKDILLENDILNENINMQCFNVYPTYDIKNYNQINGYNSILEYEIKIDDLNKVDTVVDILANNGSENINNISYKLSNFNEVYNEVLQEAKNLAAEKAKSILGKEDFVIKNIVEQEYFNSAALYRNLSLTGEVFNQNNNITISAKVKMEVE